MCNVAIDENTSFSLWGWSNTDYFCTRTAFKTTCPLTMYILYAYLHKQTYKCTFNEILHWCTSVKDGKSTYKSMKSITNKQISGFFKQSPPTSSFPLLYIYFIVLFFVLYLRTLIIWLFTLYNNHNLLCMLLY